jgi:ketosteroid isomerase-like protein
MVSPAEMFLVSNVDPRIDSQLLSVSPMGLRKATFSGASKRLSAGLALLAILVVIPTGAMPRAEKHEVRHQIENLEKAWCNAILHDNSAAMDALLADDYIAITPNGILQSKQQALASIRSGTVHFKSIDLSDRKIRIYGKTALVTSRAEVSGTSPDGDMSGNYRYTRVYVMDAKGVWRIVSFEASKIRESQDHHPSKAE